MPTNVLDLHKKSIVKGWKNPPLTMHQWKNSVLPNRAVIKAKKYSPVPEEVLYLVGGCVGKESIVASTSILNADA